VTAGGEYRKEIDVEAWKMTLVGCDHTVKKPTLTKHGIWPNP